MVLNGIYSVVGVVLSLLSYVKCMYIKSGIIVCLIKFVGGVISNVVVVLVVVMCVYVQSMCFIFVVLILKVGGIVFNYGFQIGEWVSMLYVGGFFMFGEMGWYNFDGFINVNEMKIEMDQGYCNFKIGDQLGILGVKVFVDDNWNVCFGIYKNKLNVL